MESMLPQEEWAIKTLKVGCWLDIAAYSFVLGFSLHNMVRFMGVQGRKNFYLTGFYVLTVLVAVVRILFFYYSYRMLVEEEGSREWTRDTKMH